MADPINIPPLTQKESERDTASVTKSAGARVVEATGMSCSNLGSPGINVGLHTL